MPGVHHPPDVICGRLERAGLFYGPSSACGQSTARLSFHRESTQAVFLTGSRLPLGGHLEPRCRDRVRIRTRRAGLAFLLADCGLAAVYLLLFWAVIPSRWSWFSALVGIVAAATVVGGVGMLFCERRWAWRTAHLASCAVLLAFVLLLTGLLTSAAYLHAIYGGVGQAAAAVAIIAALLSFQLVGFVPLLQLYYLARRRQSRDE